MKKLLIVILSLLLLVGCSAKKEEEPEEEEVKEPIGYKGPYYLKGTKKFELEELKDHKIGLSEYYGSEANEFVLKDLEQYGVTEENIVYMFSYNDIIDNIESKTIEMIKNMLKEKYDYNEISKISGKTIEEIKEIEKSMKEEK